MYVHSGVALLCWEVCSGWAKTKERAYYWQLGQQKNQIFAANTPSTSTKPTKGAEKLTMRSKKKRRG